VVRIGTADEVATGTFISPAGVLLTNNHVLGVGICPVEGCYARLTFMYQRHSPVQSPQTVFVVPLAVDVGLDMAVVQTYSDKGGAPLATPRYVTLDSRDPASLQGVHVNVVGHPEGYLKKWTEGDVIGSNGSWIMVSAYSLPGNSGSPLLDDAGHMVGILHRAPMGMDLVSNVGINEYSTGTASAPLIAAMTASLPTAMWSVARAATDDDVVQHQVVYLNARASSANVQGAQKAVLASLGTACDTGLARADYSSPEDLGSALTPCTDAELWIECRTDAPAGGFGVCPSDWALWQQRYQGVYDHWRALNGEVSLHVVSFAQAALASSMSAGMLQGSLGLQGALAAAHPSLDFAIANYLAAFGIDQYAGRRIVDFLKAYSSFPDYPLSATNIASTALWLNHGGLLSRTDTLSLLQALASNDNVDVATKLYIEDSLYRSKTLD
jgi:hypothetical protein